MKEIKVEIPDLNQFKKRFDNFLSSKNFDYILVKNSLIFKKDEIDELFYENLYEELTENNFLNITEFKYTKEIIKNIINLLISILLKQVSINIHH